MTRAISRYFRERIVSGHKQRLTCPELANRLSLGEATISRVLRSFREIGDLEPRPHAGGYPFRIAHQELVIVKKLVDQYPDATLVELTVLISEEIGQSVSRSTVGRTMVRPRLLPEEKGLITSERSRSSVQAKRDAYREAQRVVHPEKLAFLDEVGSHISMTREHAWCPKGERFIGAVPRNRGNVHTMLGALGFDGFRVMRNCEGELRAHAGRFPKCPSQRSTSGRTPGWCCARRRSALPDGNSPGHLRHGTSPLSIHRRARHRPGGKAPSRYVAGKEPSGENGQVN